MRQTQTVPPETRYAKSGDVRIAYQVVGEGPVDLMFVPFMINLVWAWEQPIFVDFCRRLAGFSRLILLDKRGTGLSDRPRDLPSFESRMDDIRAVMDDAGSERAASDDSAKPRLPDDPGITEETEPEAAARRFKIF